MTSDLVSIVMPAYNNAFFIEGAIQSVREQSYTNWELLIVDDCSTDDTESLIRGLMQKDERIHYTRLGTNSGAAVARNTALGQAKGRYIAFLDADDQWMPHKLERQLLFMQENGYAFTYTAYQCNKKLIYGPKQISKYQQYAFCWQGCLTVMYDRQVVGNVEIPPIRKNNDYAMWLTVIEKSDCYLFNENLACYNHHEGSISSTSYFALIRWHYILWHEVRKKNMFAALFWTGMNIFFGIVKKIVYRSNILV